MSYKLWGAAAVACAEALRQEGHSGRVVIVSDEKHLPYDRPKLSKVGHILYIYGRFIFGRMSLLAK